jgi:flagellar basal-body rod modification protein FlgD
MEPTENTEWVSQYAQFSQVEELQNMAQSMSLSRASGLVGQTVIMSVENDKGEATEVEGNVDFVSYEGGNAFLSINGELYAMSDLKHVVDSKYLAAMENTKGFVEALGKLPDVNVLTLGDKSQVEEVASKYYNLSDWEKSLLGSDEFKARLDTYISRMMALVKESESADGE